MGRNRPAGPLGAIHAFLRLRVPLATVAAAQDSALRLSIVTPLATATMRRFLVTQYMSARCPPGSSDGLEVEKHSSILFGLSGRGFNLP